MKLIKFIAAAALVASTSLFSGGFVAPVSATQQIAVCPNWPHCRDVDITDHSTEQQHYIAVCPNWPHCRDVDIADPALNFPQQWQTKVILKAA